MNSTLRILSYTSRVYASVKLVCEARVTRYHDTNKISVSKVSEPLPAQTAEVLKESFTTPSASADLTAYNNDFLKKHSDSASHLQSAYNVRQVLDASSKSTNEADLKKTLDLPNATVEDAVAGLVLLSEWNSDEKVKDDYRAKAASRWTEATIFKK